MESTSLNDNEKLEADSNCNDITSNQNDIIECDCMKIANNIQKKFPGYLDPTVHILLESLTCIIDAKSEHIIESMNKKVQKIEDLSNDFKDKSNDFKIISKKLIEETESLQYSVEKTNKNLQSLQRTNFSIIEVILAFIIYFIFLFPNLLRKTKANKK